MTQDAKNKAEESQKPRRQSERFSPPDQSKTLLVDDEPLLRRSLARALKMHGFDVVVADNGVEAAEIIKKETFDVVISDIGMPKLDGIGLLRAVRDQDLDLPVVLITGDPSLETAKRAVEYGAYQYIEKPFDFIELVKVAGKAANLYRVARLKREALGITGQDTKQAGDLAGLELSFNRALAQLWIAMQPILRAEDNSLFGYEALMRSNEPTLPHPGAVLNAAERLDRIFDVGRTVRRRATEPMLSSPDRGYLFINLHPQDLMDPDLLSGDSALAAMADRVVFEITERSSLENVKNARAIVGELRQMGFRIAIDDLGAGYAGLTSFATLQPDLVKIDMSLVRGVDADPLKQRLIQSLTQVCKDMGMLVVTEGIETEEERETLIDLGADLLQGFLLGRPSRP